MIPGAAMIRFAQLLAHQQGPSPHLAPGGTVHIWMPNGTFSVLLTLYSSSNQIIGFEIKQ